MKQRTVGERSFAFSAALSILILFAALLSPGRVVSGALTGAAPAYPNLAQMPGKTPLAPPAGLAASDENGTVTLTWNTVAGTVTFKVYRSSVQGSDYALIGSVQANPYWATFSYKDQNLVNQQTYYYVVTTVNAEGVESSFSNEVAAMPHLVISWAGSLNPASVATYALGSPDPLTIKGKFFINGFTGAKGPAGGIIGQFGYGPVGTAPNSWTRWLPAHYAGKPIDEAPVANDLYQVDFRPDAAGDYNYVFRYSPTLGRDWIYGGVTVIINPALPDSATNDMGMLHVTFSDDSSAPTRPGKPSLVSRTTRSITMGWSGSTDNAMYRYDIFRAVTSGGPYTLAGSVDAAANPLQFTDEDLVAGTTYYYVVQAVDTSFNRSAYSDEMVESTQASLVTVTLRVTVPEFTEGSIYINRSADVDGIPTGETWMEKQLTPAGQANTYQTTLTLREGTLFDFSVSRGSQATTQTNADGNSPAPTPDFVVTAGETLIERTVLNWDDPIVVAYWPPKDELIQLLAPISVTWNQAMPVSTQFVVKDITGTPVTITGTYRYDAATHTTAFAPGGSLAAGRTYSIHVAGQTDTMGITQVIPLDWSFQSDDYLQMLPLVIHNQ